MPSSLRTLPVYLPPRVGSASAALPLLRHPAYCSHGLVEWSGGLAALNGLLAFTGGAVWLLSRNPWAGLLVVAVVPAAQALARLSLRPYRYRVALALLAEALAVRAAAALVPDGPLGDTADEAARGCLEYLAAVSAHPGALALHAGTAAGKAETVERRLLDLAAEASRGVVESEPIDGERLAGVTAALRALQMPPAPALPADRKRRPR